MSAVYLGPWQWDATEHAWTPPPGCLGAVDLRTVPQMGQAGGMPGMGVFAAPGTLSGDYALLGEHPTARTGGAARDAWESLTGYRPAGARPIDLLWDALTAGSDPDGGGAPKPLLPSRQGRGHWADLRLAGRHRSEPFAWGEDAAATERVRDALQRDFRAHFAAAQTGRFRDPQHHRRVLDFWCEEYGVTNWQEFVPADLRADVRGRLKHATTLTDDFNRADAASLGAGWSTGVGQGHEVVSSTAKRKPPPRGVPAAGMRAISHPRTTTLRPRPWRTPPPAPPACSAGWPAGPRTPFIISYSAPPPTLPAA